MWKVESGGGRVRGTGTSSRSLGLLEMHEGGESVEEWTEAWQGRRKGGKQQVE